MLGKTVVITGATSGIGEVAADRLAQRGARIVFIARDRARGAAMLKHLNAIARPHRACGLLRRSVATRRDEAGRRRDRGRRATHRCADQQCRGHVHDPPGDRRRAGDDLRAQSHVLFRDHQSSARPPQGGGPARGSSPPRRTPTRPAASDFDDLQSARALFRLRRLWHHQADEHAVHPRTGAASGRHRRHRQLPASGLRRHPLRRQQFRLLSSIFGLAKTFALSPEKGAETIIYLASSPDVEGKTGGYYHKCKPATPSAAAQNDADATRLWDVSAEISGVGG